MVACVPRPVEPVTPAIEVEAGEERPPQGEPEVAGCSERIAGWQARGADDRALYNAGVTQLMCGRDSAARASFAKLVSQDARFARAHLLLAILDFEKRRSTLDETIEKVQKAIHLAKFNLPSGLLHLALLQTERNAGDDPREAKLNIQRAIAIASDAPEPYALLARYYWWQAHRGREATPDRGLLELSRRVADFALAQNPKFGPLHHSRGLALWSLGDAKEAADAFERANVVQAEPRFETSAQHQSAPRANGAIRDYRENGRDICRSGPSPTCDGYAKTLTEAASLYDDAGMPAKAIAVRKMLINPRSGLDHTPEATAAVLELARGYERLGIFDIAARFYATFAKRAPQSAEAAPALQRAIEFHYLLGDKNAGDNLVNELRKHHPNAKVPSPNLQPPTPVSGPRPPMLKRRQMVPPLLLRLD